MQFHIFSWFVIAIFFYKTGALFRLFLPVPSHFGHFLLEAPVAYCAVTVAFWAVYRIQRIVHSYGMRKKGSDNSACVEMTIEELKKHNDKHQANDFIDAYAKGGKGQKERKTFWKQLKKP